MKLVKSNISKKYYTPSQLAYFTAILCLGFDVLFVTESKFFLILASVFAFLGMLRELLSLFRKLWDTIIGKSIIVITYASLTNLAFAFAALKINHVTGIEPFPFTYTLGFTTFILMPFWLTLSSIIMLSLAIMVANIWMLLRLCLKLVGIRLKMHWEDENRAVLTMFLRIILIPLVMVMAVETSSMYFPSLGSETTGSLQFGNGLFSVDGEAKTKLIDEPAKKELKADDTSDSEFFSEISNNEQVQVESMIASFIWYLESYSHSVCKKRDDQKSVIIDDYSVLLISQDEALPVGYKFEVSECVPLYKDESSKIIEREVTN
ncbi:hypothetical protein J3L16_06740 [Alteromonas sp. 5E99-2]|uniref:hypothetical protein n=1 Tax=Alteromonas sp. 5E99-2 TaxID=2817683 RepID=UPI001A9985C8|nr:hypothetical protein [Alteromonas sp. 5E99-2]MBO1255379.1 hypothetical protein [Alteromonas sp. 5E99-2]